MNKKINILIFQQIRTTFMNLFTLTQTEKIIIKFNNMIVELNIS